MLRIRKNIIGPKKAGQEAPTIIDPSTGELVVISKNIQKVTLKYCENYLKGNKQDESLAEMVKQIRITQLKEREDVDEDRLVVDIEDFYNVLNKFQKKNTKTYDFP